MKTTLFLRPVRPGSMVRGFTLIELMVTIAIAAILLLVAIPSMTAFKRSSELTSAANNLLAVINAARGEALKRGMSAMVIPLDGTDWNSGIRAFVDVDRNWIYGTASDISVMVLEPLPSYFTVTPGPSPDTVAASSPYLMFNPSGYATTTTGAIGVAGAATLQIARNDLSGAPLLEQTRRIKVVGTGRVRTCKPNSATDSNCSMTVQD